MSDKELLMDLLRASKTVVDMQTTTVKKLDDENTRLKRENEELKREMAKLKADIEFRRQQELNRQLLYN